MQSKRSHDVAAVRAAVSNNRQLLLDKMASFDTTCQRLRQLLLVQRNHETEQQCILKHRQQLLDHVASLEQAYEVNCFDHCNALQTGLSLRRSCQEDANGICLTFWPVFSVAITLYDKYRHW